MATMGAMDTTIGILGCGDFLRWQAPAIAATPHLRVGALFDPDRTRADHFAAELGGRAADSAEAVIADPAVAVVALFVPPWIRRGLFEQACAAGKHVIMTKPLASSAEDCAAMQAAAERAGIRTAVIYSRSGDAWVMACRELLRSGRFGRLALYRQDWLHAWPQWNQWATDPVKNGGPFMDAMIHNLNAASHLMDRPLVEACFFSDRLSHPDMTCADTECLVARYADGGVAHLFITWAADLAVHSTAGNDREHIDLGYLVTDEGWHLTRDRHEGQPCIRASRDGTVEHIAVAPSAESHYAAFLRALEEDTAIPERLATLDQAAADVTLLRTLEGRPGTTIGMEATPA